MDKSPLKSFLLTLLYALFFFVVILRCAKINIGLGILAAVIIFLVVIFLKRATLYSLAAQLTFNKDKQKAFDYFEKAYKTKKMKPQVALFYSYLLLRDAKCEEADKKIDEILKNQKTQLTETDIKNAHLNKALIRWKTGDLKGAIEKAQALYDDNFKTTALYGVLGYWYILDNNYEKALQINKEAYDYNDSDLIICDNLAQNYYLLGDVGKAFEIYQNIMEKEPTFIEAYYNFACVLNKKGEKEKAIENLEKALEIDEKFLSCVTHNEVKKLLDELRNE
ncbi:MAG: hypothetical protein E7404_03320 [Ruminococcaceae bacterium]|nr:hypothetical protein [Oscillospiraceae bacterium]